MDSNYYEKLVSILNEQRGVHFFPKESSWHEYVATFFGSVKIMDGSSINLIIAFDKHFPLRLPVFYVNNDNVFRVHVESDGKICLYDKSSMLIKKEMPDQLLLDCYDQAIKILNILPGTDEYNHEIFREFDAYWMKIGSSRWVYSCFDTSEVTYNEYNMFFSSNIRVVAKTENDALVMAYNNLNAKRKESDFYKKCLVIRLRKKSSLISIRENYKWKALRNYILSNISASYKKRFEKFLQKKIKKIVQYIFLVYETPMGDIVFGFRIDISGKKYMQISNVVNAKIEPVYVKRIDYNYLLARVNSKTSLRDKKILLLGAGSIGGFLANNLCQMGVTQLDILDMDTFHEENVCRHFLGFDSAVNRIMTNKADLLKEQLEKMYPYVDIDSLNYKERSVEEFIVQYKRFENYDVIISALGEPTLNLEINRILYQERILTPFVCCFNEPYGIGGHVIVANLDKNSCLQCLYTKINASEITSFRASLVEEGQAFKKNVSGCSGAFVPYSSLDSQQTAILAARLVVKVLRGEIIENTIETWIGPCNELMSNHFRASEYYNILCKNKEYVRTKFGNAHCAICGGDE